MSLILIAFLIINERVHLECALRIDDICSMGYHVTDPLGGRNPSGTSPVRLYKGQALRSLFSPKGTNFLHPGSVPCAASIHRVGAHWCRQADRETAGLTSVIFLRKHRHRGPSCSSGGYGIAASDSVQRDETALQRLFL